MFDKNQLVLFSAPNCAPCRVMKEIINSLLPTYPKVKLTDINVWDDPEIANICHIRTVPTIMFNGNSLVGTQTLISLKRFIENNTLP